MYTLSILEQQLGYHFAKPALLKQALSHRSYHHHNNERLEFLGDSILNFVIAEALYQKFPEAEEGQLSRLRAMLVQKSTLAQVARRLDLQQHLYLGSGELRSGGAQRSSILADAVEAVIAAIYLDSDFLNCRQCILAWFQSDLQILSLADIVKDSKSNLQEWLQARQINLPDYELIDTIGKDHEQTFIVECRIQALGYTTEGRGSSRRQAEQEAAGKTLQKLQQDHE